MPSLCEPVLRAECASLSGGSGAAEEGRTGPLSVGRGEENEALVSAGSPVTPAAGLRETQGPSLGTRPCPHTADFGVTAQSFVLGPWPASCLPLLSCLYMASPPPGVLSWFSWTDTRVAHSPTAGCRWGTESCVAGSLDLLGFVSAVYVIR